MGNSDWCVDCNKVLRGKKSHFYGLCFKCRQTKERKEYVQRIDLGLPIEEDIKKECICNEGIHNGNEVDCACECHKGEGE